MSLFPRFTHEVSPIFRLLDDYEHATSRHVRSAGAPLRTFSPKFDVREDKDAYHLHGEFPGVRQDDINIEWSDGNTLTVSGRTEHHAERGSRPAAVEEAGDEDKGTAGSYHKPTVEEEDHEGHDGGKQVAAVGHESKQVAQPSGHEPKYWVTERSVGEFHRSFSFPARIDQDAVKASLKDGVLEVVVPKARAVKPRKVAIES